MSSDVHRATAYAGTTVTDYVRAGNGAVVLLLTRQQARHPLFAVLASAFRVIAPDRPRYTSADADACVSPPFASWLRDFLDGLGVARVILLADDAFALEALDFCAAEPTRVDGIALLGSVGRRDESASPSR
jgi:pimeloyl-ACP methyl ester carboxylesterase